MPSAPPSAVGSSASNGGGLPALLRKELADHLNSKRFYLIFVLLLLVTTVSLGGAISSLNGSEADSSEFLFLTLFTTGSSSIYSFATFLAFLGPLAGITLGFDAVNTERSQGTLIRLAGQPIYRDAIINAKFLAGAAVIGLITAVLGLYFCGTGMLLTGLVPNGEEVLRIAAFLLLAAVYMCVWLALAVIFSVICRHTATAALASIAIWLFLILFMSLVASGIANTVFPLDGMDGIFHMVDNYELNLAINRISPYYLFSEAATTILNPSVRSIGVVTASAASGAISSSLPFLQSLLLVWPHLVVMAGLVIAGFAVAYVRFMRQEIRA